jgi:FSR family fosmidomycin resistance protein-like MFS transporter
VVGAPSVEAAHAIDHDLYALLVFALPMLLGSLIEAPIAAASDRLSRRHLLAGSLAALVLALCLCAAAQSPWLLSIALGIAGGASGVACTLAEAEIVAQARGQVERAMSRWTAAGAVGDLLAPLVVWCALHVGGSYKTALIAVASLLGLQAWLVLSQPAGALAEAAVPLAQPPLLESLQRTARTPRLWLLLAVAALCTLLDEVLVALAALHLHERGFSEAEAASSMSALALGGLAGALLCDRLLVTRSAHVLLLLSALASLVALGAFITASQPWWQLLALAALGAAAVPQWALVQAAAYQAAPGLPGLVNALAQVFVFVEVLAPLAVGLLAAHYGTAVALACLALQPLAANRPQFIQNMERR